MIWIQATWVVLGVVLGILHAAAIWRSARRPTTTTAVIGSIRLLLVGLTLAAAAIFGGVLPAAAGWAVGFFGGVAIVLATRLRNRRRRAAP